MAISMVSFERVNTTDLSKVLIICYQNYQRAQMRKFPDIHQSMDKLFRMSLNVSKCKYLTVHIQVKGPPVDSARKFQSERS